MLKAKITTIIFSIYEILFNMYVMKVYIKDILKIYIMKILISGNFHQKNYDGFKKICEFLKYTITFDDNKINECDIIISPGVPINTSKFPNKKFIFGPHFSVFPDIKLYKINNINKNSIYIQPSLWSIKSWEHNSLYKEFQKSDLSVPLKPFPLPVDTIRFKPLCNTKREKVFIYFKRRKPEELYFIKQYLDARQIPYKIFDYIKRYSETEYLEYLQQSKYGIIVDAHESQGFAIEEALSCNVPLLVWNTKYMSQEYGSTYENIPCTTIPYWDERCGEYFYKQQDFEHKFNEFISKLESYQPRQYILDNLSVEKCAEKWNALIKYLYMDYIIITGCNDSYILTLLDFIESYKINNLDFTCLVIYNYGLNENNLKKLLHYKYIYNFEIVNFDYSKYPEHLDLKKYNGLNCNYSFKVVNI